MPNIEALRTRFRYLLPYVDIVDFNACKTLEDFKALEASIEVILGE